MALYGDHVTYDVETISGGLIHTLRLPAVSTKPAFRFEVPTRGTWRRCDLFQWVSRHGTDPFRRIFRDEKQRQRESRLLCDIWPNFCVLPAENDGRWSFRRKQYMWHSKIRSKILNDDWQSFKFEKWVLLTARLEINFRLRSVVSTSWCFFVPL